MRKYKIVEVDWKDITFYAGQFKINNAEEFGLKIFKTIGYLIHETKEHLKISMGLEITEEDNILDFIVIPKSVIIKKRFLK